jgi:hypothetical protein
MIAAAPPVIEMPPNTVRATPPPASAPLWRFTPGLALALASERGCQHNHRQAQAPMEQNQATIEELNRLNKARQVAVVVALVLLVISLLAPTMPLAVLRSLAWAVAGVLSLIHASKAKQAGLSASYMSAVIYFLVAALPLLRGR